MTIRRIVQRDDAIAFVAFAVFLRIINFNGVQGCPTLSSITTLHSQEICVVRNIYPRTKHECTTAGREWSVAQPTVPVVRFTLTTTMAPDVGICDTKDRPHCLASFQIFKRRYLYAGVLNGEEVLRIHGYLDSNLALERSTA